MELRSQLPMRQYHLAERLGEGACGAVRTVYDDDGQVFALKCFEPEEDDGTLASETIREISVLRCMRGKLGHPNVLAMLDIMEVDEDVGMVMPKLSMNLTDAIEGKAVGKNKLKVTHGLLSAVAYVHAQGFMHRDIKGDNVMLTDEMVPILIDFSLTKSLGADGVATEGQGTHTGNIGTAKYIAPEVYQSEEYGVRADIWSAGVVLLEMFMDSVMSCERDKAAYAMIESLKAQMPAAKPVTGLLRAMLATDPEQRPTASQALVMEPLASKFGTAAPTTARTILAVAEAGVKTAGDRSPPKKKGGGKGGKRKRGQAKVTSKKGGGSGGALAAEVRKAWELLECVQHSTRHAATMYAEAVAATGAEVPVEHCVLLAMKLFEAEQHNLADEVSEAEDSDEEEEGVTISDYLPSFDIDQFMEHEKLIFKAMDYCLFLPEQRAESM